MFSKNIKIKKRGGGGRHMSGQSHGPRPTLQRLVRIGSLRHNACVNPRGKPQPSLPPSFGARRPERRRGGGDGSPAAPEP